jgi:hypothetical protein
MVTSIRPIGATDALYVKWGWLIVALLGLHLLSWMVQLAGVLISIWRPVGRKILAGACVACILSQVAGSSLSAVLIYISRFESPWRYVSASSREHIERLAKEDAESLRSSALSFVFVITAIVVAVLLAVTVYLKAHSAPATFGEGEDSDSTMESASTESGAK